MHRTIVLAAFVSLACASSAPPTPDELLAVALEGADRIHVRTGGLCHREDQPEVALFDLVGEEHVETLLPLLDVQTKLGGHCMCCGDRTIELSRGRDYLTSVVIHHGKRLRWSGWQGGDGELERGPELCAWLVANGVAEGCEVKLPSEAPSAG